MAFERLLSRDSGRKTIEDVLEKRNQVRRWSKKGLRVLI